MRQTRRIWYNGNSGAIVSNKYGTWNIHAPEDHENSPVKEVEADEADALVSLTTSFDYEEKKA